MAIEANTPMERCERCWGRGVTYTYPKLRGGGTATRARNCYRCSGRGEVPKGSRNPEYKPKEQP